MIADSEWAILLDLDQTLVLTDAIEHLRRHRAWSQVYRSFSQTKLPPGTHAFVEAVAGVGRIGVVTTSPRPYAEKLLAHHQLELPVVVAYHDITQRKPHPDPILKAATKLGLSPVKCIYVGDLVDDIKAAANAGAVPIGLSWDGTLEGEEGADLARAVCENWDEVYRVILEITTPI